MTYAFENRPPSRRPDPGHRSYIAPDRDDYTLWQQEFAELGLLLRGVRAALDLLKLHLRLKAYSPDQPRVPAGSGRISGQWMGQNVGFPSFPAPASDTPRPVRVAQNRTGRGFLMEEIEPPRINGRRIDPTYRPPEGLYATINGMMDNLNAQRDDAKLFALNAERVNRGFQPITTDEMRSMYSESARNTPMSSIFMRDGNLIGYRFRGAQSGIQTVDPQTFSSVVQRSTYGATLLPTRPDYDGVWFQRNDSGVIGLRISRDSGPTIDLIRRDPLSLSLPRNLKVHTHD